MLTESPNEIIEHLRRAVQSGEFTSTNAQLFAGVTYIVNQLRDPMPQSLNLLANEPFEQTVRRINSLTKSISAAEVNKLKIAFRSDNTASILNQLDLCDRRLLALYRTKNVQHYR